MERDWIGAASWIVRLVGAAAAATWGGMAPMLKLLILLMVADVATGWLAAYASRSISSEVSGKGMAKKAAMLILVGVATVLQWETGQPLADATAGFFVAHELVSILENTGRAGAPVPDALRDALPKMGPKPPESEGGS